MKRLLFLFAFVFIVFSVFNVSASEDAFLPPISKGLCPTQLTQVCTNCTSVNITTIKFPNQTIVTLNTPMTQIGTNSYNYSTCNTNFNGILLYTTIGDPDGVLDSQTVHLPITPNGEEPTLAKALFYLGLLGLLIFFLCLIFWAHLQDQSPLARLWWFSFMWIPIWAILFIGWSMAQSFLTSQEVIQNVLYFAWLVIAILYPFYLLGLVLYTFYWVYKQQEVQRLITRGFTLEDAQGRVNGRGRGGRSG